MQLNYRSESETSGMSEDLLVWWQLAGGSMARQISKLCAHCTHHASLKLRVGLVEFTLEIKDTASV